MIPQTYVAFGMTVVFMLSYINHKNVRIITYGRGGDGGGRGLKLYFICFLLFFMPKVSFVSISSLTSTGLRYDDFFVLYIFVSLLSRKTINKRIKHGIMTMIILAGLNIIAMLFHTHKVQLFFSILSIIRKFEYFSLIFAGYYLRKGIKDFDNLFHSTFSLLHTLLMVIAIMQLTGLTSYVNRGVDVGVFGDASTVFATFNGYYEYGQFLIIGYVYYLLRWISRGYKLKDFRMVILTVTFILLTRSRSSLMWGVLITLLIVLFSRRVKPLYKIMLLGSIVTGAAVFITLGVAESDIFSRFRTVDIVEMTETLSQYIKSGDFDAYIEGNRIKNFFGMDLSAAQRFSKWGIALNGLMKYPLLGYGYGIAPVVMDGNYVRIFGELGIIGGLLWLSLYFGYIRYFFRNSGISLRAESAAWMMTAVAFGAIFIDMLEASKIMEFIWFYAGIAIYDIHEKRLQLLKGIPHMCVRHTGGLRVLRVCQVKCV